jgi:hypothetical protein
MPMGTENERTSNPLQVSREPVGPKRAGDKGSPGDRALMDGITLIVGCWVVLFFLSYSLRRHNI